VTHAPIDGKPGRMKPELAMNIAGPWSAVLLCIE
jgi:hypothetical protein